MLEACEATWRYPGTESVLGPFTVNAEAGRILTLLGPNGSGKSTLLKLLSGAFAPQSGTVHWEGRAVAEMPPRQRARIIALVPQRLHLAFDLSVVEMVELGRLHRLDFGSRLRPLSGADRDAVAHSLTACGLWALRQRAFRDLSGGEQQRVLLAMALAQETPVLLLDEPTASLDAGHSQSFMRLVTTLAETGRHVVMSHHDLSLAAQWSHRVVLLRQGQVVTAGDPTDIMTPSWLSAVYETPLGVLTHPDTGRPVVIPRIEGP